MNLNIRDLNRPQGSSLLIILLVLGIALSTCSEEDLSVSTEFTITKKNPTRHTVNDGSKELEFSDKRYNPNVIWSKEVYSHYAEVSTEYKVSGLSSGMYLLEIIRNPDSSIFRRVYLASNDTISPGDYFPLYPGSYWIFDNSDTIVCLEGYKFIGLGHRYTGISQTHGDHNDPSFPVDSIYVPAIYVTSEDREYIFYNYSITYSAYLASFSPIVDEEEGFYYVQTHDNRYDYDYNFIRILKVDTSLQIGNRLYEDVIVAEHFNFPNLVGDYDYFLVINKLYFA